ncbi:hypothetical protein [Alkalihalobacillus pseudalcaliphilus]|uniref:hypothetical protein n=1 Tax=Alkalihalobacillus pseudalcaliphilus TaxID=79884 RepID=UPI00064DACDF|nr:hypothetical protein [Alkalihalobacillus pseudalcaliphilus]KMK75661.1 hypothetical protein AB990_10275 [Alkalihalobacillus pseudalcaliphilus]
MYRRRTNPILILITIFFTFFIVIFLLIPSGSNHAEKTVHSFYQYEQEGNFSSSWQLLHPTIQERFPISSYIQDRAHVFMGHFGTDSFEYTLENPNKVSNFQMNDEKTIDGYSIKVHQYYDSKYGQLTLTQNVIVSKVEKEWLIFWE